ncbi:MULTISPECIES: ABC transporter permease [Halolamina]|uniref:Peptide/nickel transport system permease protein n=2 Tax=Halolamina pelagica TaxID=699431 RepID=A0A1I5MSU8_9EURY|nr:MULTISPECIES: ABC transporter permease [Halolamina]NHX36128.1 ABC transporter permease [Halolamina sp. R1-12]SFP12056.1 peptide/nickel transport system permease protein [Halolamina pelagica]
MSHESQRTTTTERGRIRVTGFDTSVFEDRDERFEWQQDESTVSRDRMTRAWERFKRNRTALVGLAIIAVMLFTTIFARPIAIEGITIQPFSLAPFDPTNSNFGALNQGPSAAHPFGTDWSGKDILSRVMYGGRYSLTIGVITVGIALSVGVPLGALAGYYGGWIDEVIMRLVDILYAFPFLVLAIALIAVLGQGFWNMITALVLVVWISYARLLRGEVLSVKENEYVTAAKALGARDRSIIFRHVVPNAMAPVIVQATLGIGTVVLNAAALGFLGLGLEPGSPEWGSMLARGRSSLIQGQWWITVFPGLAIFLFVLSINLVGDGVRDAVDPQGDTSGGAGVRE